MACTGDGNLQWSVQQSTPSSAVLCDWGQCTSHTRQWCMWIGGFQWFINRTCWGFGGLALPKLFILLRYMRHCYAFLTPSVVCNVYVRSSVMCTPKNSFHVTPLMEMGMCTPPYFLKSTVSYLVLAMLRARQFSWHPYVSTLPLRTLDMRPTTSCCPQTSQWRWSC